MYFVISLKGFQKCGISSIQNTSYSRINYDYSCGYNKYSCKNDYTHCFDSTMCNILNGIEPQLKLFFGNDIAVDPQISVKHSIAPVGGHTCLTAGE